MRGFVQDIFPKIADSPEWIPVSLLLVPLPLLTGEDLRGANWNAIEDDCDFRRNDAVDPSTEFTYWRPANTSLNDVSGTCPCEFVSKLFPVFYSPRDSDDFIAEPCERCIKDGRFTFNEDEIKDVEQFMQRAGLSEPLMLQQFVEIMERHPRPAWGNIHHTMAVSLPRNHHVCWRVEFAQFSGREFEKLSKRFALRGACC